MNTDPRSRKKESTAALYRTRDYLQSIDGKIKLSPRDSQLVKPFLIDHCNELEAELKELRFVV